MAAILFFKMWLKFAETSFHSPYSFCENLMKLAGIFQDLEHLYDFQTISYGGHLFFKMRLKFCRDRFS